MVFVLPSSGPDADQRHSLRFEARRCRALAADLDAIADGGFPDEATLGAAPILDDVGLLPVVLPVLTGAVTSHPLLPGTGRHIATSLVEVISPTLGWARTRSRVYRFGRLPADRMAGIDGNPFRTGGRPS